MSYRKGIFRMEYIPSIVSAVVALIALIVSVFASSKKETKEDVSQTAEILAKLNNMTGYVLELKTDMAELRQSMQNDHDRIIKLEMTVENACERIDDLQDKY